MSCVQESVVYKQAVAHCNQMRAEAAGAIIPGAAAAAAAKGIKK